MKNCGNYVRTKSYLWTTIIVLKFQESLACVYIPVRNCSDSGCGEQCGTWLQEMALCQPTAMLRRKKNMNDEVSSKSQTNVSALQLR